MKALGKSLALLLVLLLPIAAYLLHGAFQVATGYSAKQLCSGFFVANLPAEFVIERDVLPRMAILGPGRDALQLEIEPDAGFAEATLLWVSARATHIPGRGCSLHAQESGVPPLPWAPAAAQAGVPAALEPAMNAAFAEPPGGGRNTLAVLVIRRGELLAERYAPPVTAGTRMQGWSMNKSLMATWVGLQAAARAIDPERPIVALRSDLAQLDPALTLLHLLQMESGLDFEEVYGPGSDVTRMLYGRQPMWKVPASVGQAYAPGAHFAYSSGDTILASLLWQDSLGQSYPDWVRERFSGPLGLDSLIAEADSSGVQVGSSYVYMTARDWAASGQLWLDAWHGRSPLLAQSWLRASVAPRPSDPAGRYGRGFWLNTDGVAFPGLPDTLFYAGGNAGQYVVVIPELEMVVVRLGLSDPDVSTGMGELLRSLVNDAL